MESTMKYNQRADRNYMVMELVDSILKISMRKYARKGMHIGGNLIFRKLSILQIVSKIFFSEKFSNAMSVMKMINENNPLKFLVIAYDVTSLMERGKNDIVKSNRMELS